MIKFDGVYGGSVASTRDLKYAHERLNQMVSSGDCSGPLKRSARLTYEAKKVASKKKQRVLLNTHRAYVVVAIPYSKIFV